MTISGLYSIDGVVKELALRYLKRHECKVLQVKSTLYSGFSAAHPAAASSMGLGNISSLSSLALPTPTPNQPTL